MTKAEIEKAIQDLGFELPSAVKRSINEDDVILDTVSDECSAYFSGARSLDETVALIQDRVSTYVNERR